MPETPPPLNGWGKLTIVVANLTKLAGVALAVNEGLQSTPDARVLALAAFLAAGAQGVENLADKVLRAEERAK